MGLIDADEARLIDAEKLKRQLIEGDGHDDDRFTEGYNFAINEIRGYIDSMPTIYAEPVKHGQWIKTPSPYHVKCSSCGVIANIKLHGVEDHKFCWHCGAKMD